MERIYHDTEYEIVEKPGMFRTWRSAAKTMGVVVAICAALIFGIIKAIGFISNHSLGFAQFAVACFFASAAAVLFRSIRHPHPNDDRFTRGAYWFVGSLAIIGAIAGLGALR